MKKTGVIFDIGKTHKKCFLFDERYQLVRKTYKIFAETKDEDGHPADDLDAIVKWIKTIYHKLINDKKYPISSINFSTYGATLVHLDACGKVLTPLYNYTKPFPPALQAAFHKKYGNELKIAQATGSPPAGMLSAGFQLYWLKKTQPAIFKKIKWSLHFPQYLSYLFTGIPLSEFTSIGCHTSLWDYGKNDYHDWVYAEKIDEKLPPIVPATTSINLGRVNEKLIIGIGIHDSSAALLPYIRADRHPFLLVSTGTWSVSLNPFSEEILSDDDIKKGCLNYMRIDGRPVKATRIFFGKEYQVQIEKMCAYFKKGKNAHKKMLFDKRTSQQLNNQFKSKFCFEYLGEIREQPDKTDYSAFKSFKAGYHQLMMELMILQKESMKLAIGKTVVKKIYIDGGFADNDVFIKLLGFHFPDVKIRSTQSPIGSALGAAMVINDEEVSKKFLKNNYAMKKHKPELIDL